MSVEPLKPQTGSAHVLTGVALALLAGCALATDLPLLFSGALQIFISNCWLIVVLLVVGGYGWAANVGRRDGKGPEWRLLSQALVPLAGLVIVPLFSISAPTRALIIVLCVGAAMYVAYRSMKYSGAPRYWPFWIVGAAASFLFAGLAGLSVLAQNPLGAHGAYVGPFDGENWLTWLSDGTLGRVPFRDFFFPYGPILYYSRLAFAAAFGLDAYIVFYNASMEFIAALLSVYITGTIFRWRFPVLIAAPLLLFLYGAGELRMWIACAAIVTTLNALDRRTSNWMLAAAGCATMIALLYSLEDGLAALVTATLCIVWFAYWPGGRWNALSLGRFAGWFALGASVTALPAVILALIAHISLTEYLAQNVGFFSGAAYCCGLPFPALFTGSGSSADSGSGMLWLLGDPLFRTYYAGLVVLSISYAVVTVRILARRPAARDDVALAALLVFSTIAFGSALVRSDPGHLSFVQLPLMVIGLFLAERALREAYRTDRISSRHVARASLTWLGQAAAYTLFAALVLFGLLRIQDALPVLASTIASNQNYYRSLSANERNLPPPPNSELIVSTNGQRFFFRMPQGADVPATLHYLQQNLSPGDRVCGFPFITRYEFLLHRPSAVKGSCDLWDIPLPQERRRYLTQLNEAKPRYLIYNEVETPNFDWVPWTDRAPEIAKYIFSHYRVVQQIGETLIFERGTPALPPPALTTGSLQSTPFLLTGFYYPEPDANPPFRWTTLQASARLTQDPDDKFFELQLSPSMDRGAAPAQVIQVRLNDREVLRAQWPAAPSQDGRFVARIQQVAHSSPTIVSFSVDRPFAAADQRVLGLPIVSFGFVPAVAEIPPQQTTPTVAVPAVSQAEFFAPPVSETTGTPVNLQAPLTVTVSGGIPRKTVRAVEILQGNYNNTADGTLKVSVCEKNGACTTGSAALKDSKDNTYFAIPLAKPLALHGRSITLTFEDVGGTRPVALWTYEANISAGETITVAGRPLAGKALKLRLDF